ncbi:MAG: SCO family protein [Candidatus Marinimicrobia bacterium]|nr:SCO family protein [Candidatus Neomarinimicrobiota bacterium]
MFRTVFFLINILLVVCIMGCSSDAAQIPYYNTPDFTPIFLSENQELKKTVTHQISDFSFVNQNSQIITNKEIEGKVHIANFMFTSCTSICPDMTGNMKLVEEAFFNDERVAVLSYSVTPWIDTPDKLLDYVKLNDIKTNNWHFLTGNKSGIYSLARESYFAEESMGFSKDSTDFLHTEYFILVDKNKRIRGVYNGTLMLESKQVVEDIKILLEE